MTDPSEVGFSYAEPELLVELLSEKKGGGRDGA